MTDLAGHKAKHKMNKKWQAASDQVKSLLPAGGDQAAAGVQKMFDAIADAGTDPNARLQAALTVFSDNTLALRDAIHATNSTPAEGGQMAKALLQHTLTHFNEIQDSVLNGHAKD
jgi:hypothetical protein